MERRPPLLQASRGWLLGRPSQLVMYCRTCMQGGTVRGALQPQVTILYFQADPLSDPIAQAKGQTMPQIALAGSTGGL